MAYEKTKWSNTTPINPTNLNKIEEVIEQNSKDIETNNNNLDAKIGDLNTLNTTDKSSLTGAINEVIDKLNYSTDEKIIGTWIDGKPLYRKVYSGVIKNTDKEVLQSDITNMNIIDAKGKVVNQNGTQLVLGHLNEGYGAIIYLYSGALTLQHTSDITGNYHVILEYTKTTD